MQLQNARENCQHRVLFLLGRLMLRFCSWTRQAMAIALLRSQSIWPFSFVCFQFESLLYWISQPSQDTVFQGAYPRWHILFNITMLRLISFNMDYYWSRTTELESVTAHLNSKHRWSDWSCKKGISNRPLTEKERQTTPHSAEIYTFANYLTYVLYPPLYIGGPIMSFNDFMWQVGQDFFSKWDVHSLTTALASSTT